MSGRNYGRYRGYPVQLLVAIHCSNINCTDTEASEVEQQTLKCAIEVEPRTL
jgi:hypothetical protein